MSLKNFKHDFCFAYLLRPDLRGKPTGHAEEGWLTVPQTCECYFIQHQRLHKYNVIKNVEMGRLSWIV